MSNARQSARERYNGSVARSLRTAIPILLIGGRVRATTHTLCNVIVSLLGPAMIASLAWRIAVIRAQIESRSAARQLAHGDSIFILRVNNRSCYIALRRQRARDARRRPESNEPAAISEKSRASRYLSRALVGLFVRTRIIVRPPHYRSATVPMSLSCTFQRASCSRLLLLLRFLARSYILSRR